MYRHFSKAQEPLTATRNPSYTLRMGSLSAQDANRPATATKINPRSYLVNKNILDEKRLSADLENLFFM